MEAKKPEINPAHFQLFTDPEYIKTHNLSPNLYFQLFDPKSTAWLKTQQILFSLSNSKEINSTMVLSAIIKISYLNYNLHTDKTDQYPNLQQFLSNIGPQLRIFSEMSKFALQISDYFPDGKMPILQECQSVQISRKCTAALIIGAFLGIYPPQNAIENLPQKQSFGKMFTKTTDLCREKLKFYFNYFDMICSDKVLKGDIKVYRNILKDEIYNDKDFFFKCDGKLTDQIKIDPKGKIDKLPNCEMVDFAGRKLGGGIMNKGATQEEILFLNFPELYITRMLNRFVNDNEAVIIKGVQQFSKSQGYGGSVKFDGPFEDTLYKKFIENKPESNIIDRSIIAIDATNFRSPTEILYQLRKPIVDRELKKLLVGFMSILASKTEFQPIATGKWGCGVFNGHNQLKFLLQWIAASYLQRKIIFCSFEDKRIEEFGNEIIKKYQGKPIKDLYAKILEINKKYLERNSGKIQGNGMPRHFDTFLFYDLLNNSK